MTLETEPTLLRILKYPDDMLHEVSVDVTEFNEALEKLVFNMLHTMREANGIGLAAPQIGRLLNIITIWIKVEEYDSGPLAFINPEIVSSSTEMMKFNEGCLSIPGYFEDRERSKQIIMKWKDLAGAEHEAEFNGLFAFAIQHEVDHLNGKLFIDGASMLKRSIIRSKIKKASKNK